MSIVKEASVKGKTILLSIIAIVLAVILLPMGFHLLGKVAHNLSKPDPIICVAGHNESYLMPVMIGKVMELMPATRYICDREGYNPNYAAELAKWNGGK